MKDLGDLHMIQADGRYFEMVSEYRNAFDEEQFANRYSDILDKYDFVVGDIGYDQLRLKGFYKDANKKVEASKRFSAIQDYILEYCNFGCAYFVLRRLDESEALSRMTQSDEVEPEIDEYDKLKDVKIKPTIQTHS